MAARNKIDPTPAPEDAQPGPGGGISAARRSSMSAGGAPSSGDGSTQPASLPAFSPSPVPQAPPPSGGQVTAVPANAAANRRSGRTIGRVLGWIAAVILGTAIGSSLFLLAPDVFNRLIRPVQQNAADVARLDSEVDALGTQISQLQTSQLDSRSSAETRLADAEGRLAESEGRLRDAEDLIAEQQKLIDQMEQAIKTDADSIEALQTKLNVLQAELPGKAEYAEYNRQLLLMRTWQEILKARLRLMENNAGLALETLAEAHKLLDQAYAASSAEQQAALDPVLTRLEAATTNITANPFSATGDLEIAWHDLGLLIGPLPAPPSSTPAPTPLATPEATSTP